jgi:hypothetical protein
MPRLTCAFGSTIGEHGTCGPTRSEACARCNRESARLRREFWMDVFFGEYDRFGYTPADRADQRQRARERAVSA